MVNILAWGDNIAVITLHCSKARQSAKKAQTFNTGVLLLPIKYHEREDWSLGQLKLVTEVTKMWEVPEYNFLGRFINRYAQLAPISALCTGSRPELVVKAVPMLASEFGFSPTACLQTPDKDTLQTHRRHTAGML